MVRVSSAITLLLRTSGSLVLFIPQHRLPQLNLVPLRVHDPCELPVFSRFGAFDDFDPARTELLDHLPKIVDPVVDHERRVTRAEPLGFFFCDDPDGESLVLGFVIWPSENSAAKALECHTKMLLIPGRKRGTVAPALEEDSADSGNFRHGSSIYELSMRVAVQRAFSGRAQQLEGQQNICCAGSAATTRFGRMIRELWSSTRQPRCAASIAAMSILFISIIASNARLAAARSGSVIALVRAIGVICQDTPHLSLHQPHALSSPPLPTIAFQ